MQTKKIWNFLGSMQFALLLLLILVVACTAGSLIPQQEIENYYFSNYSERFANFILAVGLNNVFRCWWFVLLVILLCINLLLCNLLRFPQLVRRTRQSFGPQPRLEQWDGTPVIRLENPEILFREMGFRKVQSLQWNGTACLYACKNKIGLWGAWLCHLGMLVVIVGFALGQILQQEYTVYGIPGQTKPIGDTPYVLTIDDFEIRLREDDTVDQYESWLTLTNIATGESASGSSMVNFPLSCMGWKLYQNSTGWAATMEVYRGEEHVQQQLLCAGEYAYIEGMNDRLILFLRAFYPDYAQDAEGNSVTLSPELNNPAYVYMLYFDEQLLGMNVLMGNERITVDNYSILFHDPQPYTLIQIKRDPYQWVVGIGALLIMAALLLAFYLPPAEIWAVQQANGLWDVAGRSLKANRLYQDTLERKGRVLVSKN